MLIDEERKTIDEEEEEEEMSICHLIEFPYMFFRLNRWFSSWKNLFLFLFRKQRRSGPRWGQTWWYVTETLICRTHLRSIEWISSFSCCCCSSSRRRFQDIQWSSVAWKRIFHRWKKRKKLRKREIFFSVFFLLLLRRKENDAIDRPDQTSSSACNANDRQSNERSLPDSIIPID